MSRANKRKCHYCGKMVSIKTKLGAGNLEFNYFRVHKTPSGQDYCPGSDKSPAQLSRDGQNVNPS